jgi:hypothetical protein
MPRLVNIEETVELPRPRAAVWPVLAGPDRLHRRDQPKKCAAIAKMCEAALQPEAAMLGAVEFSDECC